eukprot:TRINITY_DN1815_c0_g1_i1.p1 TRINITY_DN1815_c0_g1~~TRINITY_DN1815_c0_g1_i1.p1  ORF type:complete len:640 (+),score=277.97 TRINITY_DN1815_c0_g1_i1:77-1921(+)
MVHTSPNEPISVDVPEVVVPESVPSTPKSPTFRVKDAQAMSLSWHDLVFEVDTPEGKKQIVKGSSGHFKPGTLTALMGPSGAGKTTLMNVLAGRAPYGEIASGKVLLNDMEAEPHIYQKQLAYVMQHDAMFATQTPREVLHFTAALRLPEYSQEQRNEIVESAITALHLQKCADTLIGSVMIPGLSGGEKKRAAVAAELISSPSLIFLDEPTSGLDSHSAFGLVLILKALAESGCTIVCTIHQPSSEVFALFEDVIFLRSGHILYNGPTKGVSRHFETSEIKCKRNTNPSDFAMQRLQTMDEAEAESLVTKVPDVPMPEIKGVLTKAHLKTSQKAGTGVQLMYLLKREFTNMIRDTATLVARFGMAVMLSLLIGIVFYDVGSDWGFDNDPTSRSVDIQSHFGALVFICVNSMFLTSQPMLLAFPLERATFIREYASGTYGTAVYLIAKTMLDVPAALVQQLLGTLVFYFLCGMNGNFGLIMLSISLLGVVCASLALVLGAATTAPETAMNILPGMYVPQILFAGFFISSESIPVWLRWVQWICPLKYGVNLCTLAEFTDDATPDNRLNDTQVLLDRSEVERDDWWLYVMIMIVLFFALRGLSGFLLSRRAKKFE